MKMIYLFSKNNLICFMKAYKLQIIKSDESYTLPLEVNMLDTLPLEIFPCPGCFTY